MDLRITYTNAEGVFCVVSPVPWFRNVKAVHKDGERLLVKPPAAFEAIAPVLRSGGLAVSRSDLAAFQPEWAETEEQFAQRIAAKDIPADAKDVKVVHVSEL